MSGQPASQRVVFDCNVFLQALASPDGPAGRCVQLAVAGTVQLFISVRVITELRDVTSRAKIVAKLKLTADRTAEFIMLVESAGILIADPPEQFALARDPDDAHYVNLALAANASLIVSRDDDLLDLMRQDLEDARQFQLQYPSLKIIQPIEFLREFSNAT